MNEKSWVKRFFLDSSIAGMPAFWGVLLGILVACIIVLGYLSLGFINLIVFGTKADADLRILWLIPILGTIGGFTVWWVRRMFVIDVNDDQYKHLGEDRATRGLLIEAKDDKPIQSGRRLWANKNHVAGVLLPEVRADHMVLPFRFASTVHGEIRIWPDRSRKPGEPWWQRYGFTLEYINQQRYTPPGDIGDILVGKFLAGVRQERKDLWDEMTYAILKSREHARVEAFAEKLLSDLRAAKWDHPPFGYTIWLSVGTTERLKTITVETPGAF